jgi:hypothetical protein
MFRNYAFLMLIGCLCSLLPATDIQAQNPGAGRIGGGSGNNMMGGMGSGPWGKVDLLKKEMVQKELELTDEQKTKVNQAVDDAFSAMYSIFPRMARQNLSSQQKEAMILETMKKSQDKCMAKVNKILNSNQLERLKQICLQADGTMALMNPDVIKALNIAGEQQATIKSMIDETQNKMREEAASTGIIKTPKDLESKVLAVLTADQRDQFEKMKGKKFEREPSSNQMSSSNSKGVGGYGSGDGNK